MCELLGLTSNAPATANFSLPILAEHGAAAAAEPLLGIENLYQAVMTRLDAVSFAITTRYQKRMTTLQFWLTLVFGATEIGFIASGIATWYYKNELSLVLAWTIGTSIVAAIVIASLLRGKLD